MDRWIDRVHPWIDLLATYIGRDPESLRRFWTGSSF
jgi:hypothetical protein